MPQLIRFYHYDINLHRLRAKGGIVCACVRGGGDQMVELQKGEILKFSNEASRVFQILLLNNSFSSALPPRLPFFPAPPRPPPPQKSFCDSDVILAKLFSGEEQWQIRYLWDYNDDHLCQTKILYWFSRSFYSYDVMLKCWQHSPDNRPSFEELSAILRQILEEQEVRIYG